MFQRTEAYPAPLARSDWHSFVLPVDPEGRCELFIDRRLALNQHSPQQPH